MAPKRMKEKTTGERRLTPFRVSASATGIEADARVTNALRTERVSRPLYKQRVSRPPYRERERDRGCHDRPTHIERERGSKRERECVRE